MAVISSDKNNISIKVVDRKGAEQETAIKLACVSSVGEKAFDDEFVAFDLETTGLSSKMDTIIEIGAVMLDVLKKKSAAKVKIDAIDKAEKAGSEPKG